MACFGGKNREFLFARQGKDSFDNLFKEKDDRFLQQIL
jgi:hypothetical protein